MAHGKIVEKYKNPTLPEFTLLVGSVHVPPKSSWWQRLDILHKWFIHRMRTLLQRYQNVNESGQKYEFKDEWLLLELKCFRPQKNLRDMEAPRRLRRFVRGNYPLFRPNEGKRESSTGHHREISRRHRAKSS